MNIKEYIESHRKNARFMNFFTLFLRTYNFNKNKALTTFATMSSKQYQKINHKTAHFLSFVLIILAASMIAKLSWYFLAPNAPQKYFTQLNGRIYNASKLTLPNTLFGVFTAEPSKKDHTKVKKTPLNLTLIGILKHQNNPLAIIKNGNAKEKIYKINDSINATTKLIEIYAKYIILNRDGEDEKLSLQTKLTASKIKNTIKQTKPISRSNKRKLRAYLKKLPTNPRKLLSVVNVKPNFNNTGDLQGFVVSPGNERALFKQLGFKKNDIILNINNTPLTKLSQVIQLRRKLSTQKQFDFVIDRNGFIHNLSINLN